MEVKEKQKKGISLIVLIITIIVMIVLAGAIIISLNNSGIIGKATDAKTSTQQATTKERISMVITSAQTETKYNITDESLKNACDKEFGENKTYSKVWEDNSITIIENNIEYYIDEKGNITINYDSTPMNDKTPGILSGAGTEDEPYLIESIEDLLTFSKETSNYAGKIVKLNRILDFKSINSYIDYMKTDYGDINGNEKIEPLSTELTTGQGFPPICNFYGTFDGNGYEIRNLYINYLSTAGLFNTTKRTNMTIKNLGVTGYVQSKDSHAGGIVGAKAGGILTIVNCYNKAKVLSYADRNASHYGTGGLVGKTINGTKLNVINSYNIGDINRFNDTHPAEKNGIGGLIGRCGWDSYKYNTRILNSYNLGKINDTQAPALHGTISTSYGGSLLVDNCYYFDNGKSNGQGTIMKEEKMRSNELVNLLNTWVDTNNNDAGEYYQSDESGQHVEYKQWKLGEDGYPIFK